MSTPERSMAYDDTLAVGATAFVPTRGATTIDEGQILAGRYRVGPLLGCGGMGLVFEGTHLELENAVAIKVVRPQLASDQHILERFVNEARGVATLTSPHIARVFDAGQLSTGEAFLVMERLVGRQLSHILSQAGHLDWRTAVSYVLQACEGLTEAHDNGLIHRDLKPEHLFIVTAGSAPLVKILDFGISKNISIREARLTDPGDSIGSPSYMSPEQMQNPAAVDQRTDIWSLGVVLYEAVSGQLPFPGNTLGQIQWQVMAEPPAPLDCDALGLPLELVRIIERCLQKDQRARFGSTRELSQALRHVLDQPVPLVAPVAASKTSSAPASQDEEVRPVFAPVARGQPGDEELAVAGLPRRSGVWTLLAPLLVFGAMTALVLAWFGGVEGALAWSRGLQDGPALGDSVRPISWVPPTPLPKLTTEAPARPSSATSQPPNPKPTEQTKARTREPELSAEEIESRYRRWLRREHLVPVDEVTLDH